MPTHDAKPNSRYDLYENGEKIQSRWFDENGDVVRNRDYNHQNAHNNHNFPHDHNWNRDKGFPQRDANNLVPDYERYN